MADYRASDELVRTLRRRFLTSAVPMALLAVAAGAGVVMAQRGPIIFLIPLIALVLAVSMANAYRRQTARVASLRYSVTRNDITQTIDGTPPFTLARASVERIELHPTGEITLAGAEQSLRIPREIHNREALLDELRDWAPVQDGPPIRSGMTSTVGGLGVMIGFAAVVLSQDPRVVVPVGIALVATLVWSAIAILRNPHVDARTRRMALFMILPLAAIVMRVITVLRG